MKGLSIFFFLSYFSLFLLSLLGEAEAGEAHTNGVYIVYMGAATSPNGTLRLRDDHTQLLTSLSKRKSNALVHTYKNGFSGFAARLTKEEAKSMAAKPGVVSVFPVPIWKLHTTHSWDFLKYQTDLEIDSSPSSESGLSSQESDTIIGILDTSKAKLKLCYGSVVLAAFDEAIADGFDVLSLSIVATNYSTRSEYSSSVARQRHIRGSQGSGPATLLLAFGNFHVMPTGIAAAVKSQFPAWATQTNNTKGLITTDSGSVATPYDYFAGEVTTTGLLQPGLVYETNPVDYLEFLRVFGYDIVEIKLISPVVPDGFTCPEGLSANLISDMNYPTIAISCFDGKESKRVIRTVTNVSVEDETLYTATVDVPTGLEVEMIPEKLQFTKKNKKLGYRAIFISTTSSQKEDLFGSIT
ncbi:CO(2)-response secreted protease [Actinidia chinensis var. chinensis]|uniref:CO(2)-response secreted protease n=1 Tax=Actinidia chinensis var. chinensis TaxID=1590841 RepID=A0A2R6RMH5_ACTCC|nr:CO(2)-response secreted protease [Actinidia chinensis var. chinensis]